MTSINLVICDRTTVLEDTGREPRVRMTHLLHLSSPYSYALSGCKFTTTKKTLDKTKLSKKHCLTFSRRFHNVVSMLLYLTWIWTHVIHFGNFNALALLWVFCHYLIEKGMKIDGDWKPFIVFLSMLDLHAYCMLYHVYLIFWYLNACRYLLCLLHDYNWNQLKVTHFSSRFSKCKTRSCEGLCACMHVCNIEWLVQLNRIEEFQHHQSW